MARDQTVPSQSFKLLKDSLDEAQASVRAYDTKAQIVGVGYIFALNIISNIGELSATSGSGSVWTIVGVWLLVVLPMILFGYVLYPSRKAHSLPAENEWKHIFYLQPGRYQTPEELIQATDECDPLDEVAGELLRISALRETKRKRFVVALAAAAITFCVFFAADLALSL